MLAGFCSCGQTLFLCLRIAYNVGLIQLHTRRSHLSVIDNVLKANELYSESYTNNNLPAPPALKLAVITCKDARMMVEEILGLKEGDAHIIRNAGGVVTPDVIRSLLVSHYMLGAQEVMIINHTGCGMMSFTDEQLFTTVRQASGTAAA